jgi:hypothetical protein
MPRLRSSPRVLKTAVVWISSVLLVWLVADRLWRLISWLRDLPDAQGKNVVGLVEAVVWPAVAVVALLVLSRPLGNLLGKVGSRITRISVFDVSIEIAQLDEFKPGWSQVPMDVRKVTPDHVFDSASRTLFEQFTAKGPADYVVVDLGDGRQWLTSRLYLFAVMLQRMRGVKAFVFLATGEGNRPGAYLGSALADDIRWGLAKRYVWFEASFARAYADRVLPPAVAWPDPSLAFSATGAVDADVASGIAHAFVNGIQQPAPPLPAETGEWVEFPGAPDPPEVWEKARWITPALLRDLLGNSLDTSRVTFSALDTPPEQVRTVAACEDRLVGVVRQTGVFEGLVDRGALLEEVAVRTLAASGAES